MAAHPAKRHKQFAKIVERALAKKLVQQTHFSQNEVNGLIKIFKQFSHNKRFLDKDTFIEMLHNSLGMTDEFFMERVFFASDIDKNGHIGLHEFVRSLSIMLRGSVQEKIKFCFIAYDIKEDLQLNREVLCTLLKQSQEDADDRILDMVEIFMKRMDTKHDGILTFEEYEAAVKKDLLLLEILGPILPEDKFRVAFLAMFAEEHPLLHITV